ncbi:MAG TPA: 50S ribosomal protein L6 [Phycisphaerae bacterium]|nr:50S ribosomal protein L6 [Phycisphaerae bacterium]
MSRIGRKPIDIPASVKVSLQDRKISVEGPKGSLAWTFRPEITVVIDDAAKSITVDRDNDERFSRSLHGLTRSLIANMIIGCTEGFEKKLEIYGVGYGAQLQGNTLSVSCGLSHQALFEVPDGVIIDIKTPQARGDTDPARMTITGVDKQAVGEFAARVRKARPPEPYKGKGIRYSDEHVRRKVGKAFAGAGS